MLRFRTTTVALAILLSGLAAAPAGAVDLVAIGKLSGTLRDLSGQSALLENGVPGDLLGGLGSGLAWAGGSTFLALPDRGPNAVPWNAGLDDTASYVPRFHTLQLDLVPVPDAATGLPFVLRPTLLATTLLFSHAALTYGNPVEGHTAVPAINTASRHYFSGRSDNFDPATTSADTNDARLDPEGIRVSHNGNSVYVTDEYGPYLYEFDRRTGERRQAIPLPARLAIAHKSPVGAEEIAGNRTGRVANKGMEGLAISPDGKMLFGFVQSPLIEDGGDGGRANRIVAIEVGSEKTRQYAYDNFLADTGKAFNSSELLALNDHELLVLERDGKGLGDDSKAVIKRIYKIDLADAQDVSALTGEAALLAKAVPKTLFLDIVAKLTQAGLANTEIPAKLEGMAFGEDIVAGGVVKHTLYVGNDNDFLPVTPGGKHRTPTSGSCLPSPIPDLDGSTFVHQKFSGEH